VSGWRTSRWWVAGITLLGVGLRLYRLGDPSFWFDECFTYTVTLAPLCDSLAALLVAGIYSPFYFLLLRLPVALVGSSEYAFRFLSAAFGILTVPLLYRLGRRLLGKQGGLLAALLLAVCPFHVWYSQDARMYALLSFFCLAAMDQFELLLSGRQNWILFIACSALAYLTHYAAGALIYVQLMLLLPLLRRGRLFWRWFLAQVAALAPLVPWLVLYLVHGVRPAGLGWIPCPSALAPLRTLWNFTSADTVTFTPLVIVLMLAVGAVVVRAGFPWDGVRRLLFWWLMLPILVVFVLSLWRSYYVDRYFTGSLPAYLLWLALGIGVFSRPAWRTLAAVAVLLAMGWGTVRLHHDPYFAKEDWRGVAQAIDAGLQPGDVVALQDYEAMVGTSVYREREWPQAVLVGIGDPTPLDVVAEGHKRVWLVWRSPREANHRLSKSELFDVFAEADPPTVTWLAAHRGQVALELRFPGLSVVRVEMR